MQKLHFNKCDYNCEGKSNKRGSFRVYCRRIDPKCKTIITKVETTTSVPTVHLHPIETKYALIIQQVIAQYPKHRIHGSQFFLIDNQLSCCFDTHSESYVRKPHHDEASLVETTKKFIADRIPTIQELKKAKEIILVHSHSALNWEKVIEKYGKEEFQPFTDGDVDAFRKGLKEGWLTGEIVIMADGRMDFIGVSSRATREQIVAFLNLGPKTIGRDLNLPEGERIETGNYPFARKRLRVFAAKYGLNFQEGLHWL